MQGRSKRTSSNRGSLARLTIAVGVVTVLAGCGVRGAVSTPSPIVQSSTPAASTVVTDAVAAPGSPTQTAAQAAILLATFTPAPTLPPTSAPQPAASPPAPPAPAPSPVASPAAAAERVRVIGTGPEGLNLRAEPGGSATRVKTIRDGTVLEIAGEDQQADSRAWRNVRDPSDGVTGWAAAQFLTAVSASATPPAGGAASKPSAPRPAASQSAAPKPAAPQLATKPAGSGAASAQPQGSTCPQASPIKGNLSSSGERIYHQPGSASYTVTRPEACFASPGEAEAAGYRRALR